MSLTVMAKLNGEEYHVDPLKREKEASHKSPNVQPSEEKNLKQLEESINKCSFGLEHIVRELAQLFLITNVSDYAGAAAKMLISGHTLELVDGHSSYIPLRWFKAVYRKLEDETNNAKIFVISVLGIQSSGKSTLLNTMFGLDFSVSAGKCTRGAFASLIPCASDALDHQVLPSKLSEPSKSSFDYLLIIDTEGLRGSGDPELRKHDNKLATFAIGIADFTVVNISGENHNEIKEFLEIAVHAFLKMQLVNEKKICKIVLQNVVATDATEKLVLDRLKLINDLDKMAKLAAIQENCEDKFQKLNDIISFDVNKDVFYLRSLLKGSPPMAPVNPEYGRAVQRVKENIISLMCSESRFQFSVFQFRERVCNIWLAMQKENFIFSFRNTIEVRAYKSLDRKYFDEFVNLLVNGLAQLDRKIEILIKRCGTLNELEATRCSCTEDVHKEGEALGKAMENAMQEFFKTNEDKATLDQWRENVMNRIKQDKEIQVRQIKENLEANYHHWQNRKKVNEKKQTYKKVFIQNATKFIISADNTKGAEECKVEFEQKWQQWIEDVPECQERKTDVKKEMGDVLCFNDACLVKEMTEKLKEQNFSILNFMYMRPVIDLEKIIVSHSYSQRFGKCISKHFLQQQHEHERKCLSAVTKISDQAKEKAISFAKDTSNSGDKCGKNHIVQLYEKVITTIEERLADENVKLHTSVKCDILLYSFANACQIFDKMEEEYFKERDLRGELTNDLRDPLENLFVNSCSQMGKEVLAASSIFDVVQKLFESQLKRTMGPVVASKLMKVERNYQSKGQLHASALIHLGKEGKFESYIPYLKNAVKFLENHLMESIENYCLDHKNVSSINKLLKDEADKIENEVFNAISYASEQTKLKSGKLNFWIQCFVKVCSTIDIRNEMFVVQTAIVGDLKNIDLFEGKIREKVTQCLESLVKHGVDRATMRKWNPSPHDHLFALMHGCQSCCPFCGVLCEKSSQNHPGVKHATGIHRPQCLNSFTDIQTGELDVNICTQWLSVGGRFSNSDTSGEWHQYKDYMTVNDYYESWSMSSDSTYDASIYWQWFLATFSKELADHFGAKHPQIPPIWETRCFELAEAELRHTYDI